MKKIIIAAVMTISSSAFAQICEVDMVDNRTNRIITTIRAYDYNDGCKEGMKACRLEIRQRGLLNRADCVRASQSTPTPGPRPYPQPYPQDPYPQPYPSEYDARRPLTIGEPVIYNGQNQTVAGISFSGTYALRGAYNIITNNVRRESISVTNGCNGSVCVGDSVINIQSASFVTVAGLSYNDQYVLRGSYNVLTSNVSRNYIAETQGCVSSRYAQICVGNQVINSLNQYATVAGVQLDGRLVLRGSYNILTTNVDPSSLVITR